MMSEREKHVEKIRRAKRELETAGAIHKKDLQKYIYRMERQLRIYDRYHKTA